MNILEEALHIVTLPTSAVPVINWLFALAVILTLAIINNERLQKLTKNKLSIEKIVKDVLKGVFKSMQLREGIEPWPFNRKIKKFCAYLFGGALTYGCIVFSVLFIISLLMFVLRKNPLPFEQALQVWMIILTFGWAARFAYVEARLAFKNAKSI